jgi:hypothetical protein
VAWEPLLSASASAEKRKEPLTFNAPLVPIDELLRDYAANEVAADQKYKGT